jgi:L-ascorbate metabolism protein UlaG (beta-lactamase superfamily)
MRRRTVGILALLALTVGGGLLVSCTSMGSGPFAYYDETKPHRTREGFRNNYADRGTPDFWKWQRERIQAGKPAPPQETTPSAEPDVAFLKANATEPTLTWIGHSTLLLQVGTYNILTDPHLSERASPVSFYGPRRMAAPGLDFSQLPRIDIVLISHNHYDHLDSTTVRRLAAQEGGSPLFVVPLGLEQWMRNMGVGNVVELDWWDRIGKGSLDIHLVPVQHWSQRTLWDRNKTLWGGFYVRHHSLSFMFAGDTGYSQDFADIRKRLGAPDIAAIPVGAYEPRWFMGVQHVDPAQAVKIHQDLGARYSVGMHWGVFELADESLDEPPKALSVARVEAGVPADRFFVMKLGETRRLGRMLQQKEPAPPGP